MLETIHTEKKKGMNHWTRLMCLLGLFGASTPFVAAQIEQTARFESKQKGRDEYFSIIPLKEQGIVLIREKNKFEDRKQLWEIVHLDTLLVEKHKLEIGVDERYPFIGYDHAGNELQLLYREGDTNRNSFELIALDLLHGEEIARYKIEPELDFKITHFNKVGSNVVLGGYVSNEPAVLVYQPRDNQMKVLPGFFQKNNELAELRVNQNRTFNVILIDRSMRSEPKLIFRTYDENGLQLLEDIIELEEKTSLQTTIASTLEREDLLVFGTWGDRQGKQSKGFFSFPVDPFSDQKINYVAFGQLENFTDYLSSKRAERIKEHTKEDLEDNRTPGFSAYTMPFRIAEHPKGFVVLAEVYNRSNNVNPYYNNPYYSPYYFPGSYGAFWPGYFPGMRMYRPYPYGPNPRNSDEIKTIASVAVAFDGNGKVLWDQCLKIDDVKKPGLEQVTDFFFDGEEVFFLSKKESDINAKVIGIEDGEAKEVSQKVMLKEPGDEIRHEKEAEEGVKHWYGRHFYTWGYQTLRNNSREDRVRDVFYINKVSVH